MKNSVRLSSMGVSILFIIIFAVLFTFASEWYSNRVELENLAYRERVLHNDLEHLEVVGKWTLDYVKIEKALTYMLGDRISEVSFRILAEQLWQISIGAFFGSAGLDADKVRNGDQDGEALWSHCRERRGLDASRSQRSCGFRLLDTLDWKVWKFARSFSGIQLGPFRSG